MDVVKTALLYSWHLVLLLCFAILTLLPMKFKLWCSKREIKVIQNIRFSQNREIQVSRNMRTSKSWNKHVAKISCNNVYMTTFTRSRVYSMKNSCQCIAIHMMSWRQPRECKYPKHIERCLFDHRWPKLAQAVSPLEMILRNSVMAKIYAKRRFRILI